MSDGSEPVTLSPTRISEGSATGSVRLLLRAEGLTVLSAAILVYLHGGHSWWLLVILFLAPDLSFFAYAMGPRTGAVVYNAFHSYIGPLTLACVLWFTGYSLAIPLIWIAHIGLDRSLGYGLKYPTGFGDTHLGKLGRRASENGIR
jgi:hypothetical protein